MSLRVKLFLALIAINVLSIAGADLYLSQALEQQLSSQIQADLRARLRLVSRELETKTFPLDRNVDWNDALRRTAESAGVRLSLIGLDGVLLADTEVAFDALPSTENHAYRPEVMQALASGFGSNERTSVTVNRRMIYVAMPLLRQQHTVAIVRAALSLDPVDSAIRKLHRTLLVASVLGIALAFFLSLAAAQRLTLGIGQLIQAAKSMAD